MAVHEWMVTTLPGKLWQIFMGKYKTKGVQWVNFNVFSQLLWKTLRTLKSQITRVDTNSWSAINYWENSWFKHFLPEILPLWELKGLIKLGQVDAHQNKNSTRIGKWLESTNRYFGSLPRSNYLYTWKEWSQKDPNQQKHQKKYKLFTIKVQFLSKIGKI